MPQIPHGAMAELPRIVRGPGMEPYPTSGHLLDVMQTFVRELRAAGLPVSMTENLDAMRAVEHIEFIDRATLRDVLAATLVKNYRHRRAFETVFDVYFSRFAAGINPDPTEGINELLVGLPGAPEGGGALGEMTPDELMQMLMAALSASDTETLERLAAAAVSQFAGMEPGRPVGGTYYLYRTLRQMGFDSLFDQMLRDQPEPADPLEERLVRERIEDQLQAFKDIVEAEIRRRLVADRGVEAMARTLRKPLPEDVDFMHASRDEMVQLQHAIEPLTRALAARLAQRRKRRNRGALDFRATVRHSLSYGGVPAEPKFRRPRPSKPEIMVVADISGSVASFARFTLQFVYAMSSQFSRVRSWVFIDGIDEVTRFFDESDDVAGAIQRVNAEADVVWVDGHSDYGHAFEVFYNRHEHEVTTKTTLIVLGDARNNYHASQSWVLGELRLRARRVYWLNPEPKGYWNSGDSIIAEYGEQCDQVFECRNLRQLERFVASVVQ